MITWRKRFADDRRDFVFVVVNNVMHDFVDPRFWDFVAWFVLCRHRQSISL